MRFLYDPVFWTWIIISGVMFGLGIFALSIWFQVRGIRGMALATLALSLSLLTTFLAWETAGVFARVSQQLVAMGIRAVFPVLVLSVGVLIDIWAADHNDHRSVTTITYQAFKRMTQERERKRKRREIHEGMGG